MYETYYDKLQPHFGQKNFQLHYTDTDGFVLSVKTNYSIRDLKKLEYIFDFSSLDENHELFSNKNKKVIGKFKIETPEKLWIAELIALRSKRNSFICRDNIKNKLKGISKPQSKHIKFEEFKKYLDREEYQRKCKNDILRSINHEMHLQEVKKSTLSIFHDKRCYIKKLKANLGNNHF